MFKMMKMITEIDRWATEIAMQEYGTSDLKDEIIQSLNGGKICQPNKI